MQRVNKWLLLQSLFVALFDLVSDKLQKHQMWAPPRAPGHSSILNKLLSDKYYYLNLPLRI